MTDKTPQQIKQEALEKLERILPGQREQLRGIDARLLTYYEGLQDGTLHNMYEGLGGVKFLRVLRTYQFSQKRVAHAIQLYEGRWKDGEVTMTVRDQHGNRTDIKGSSLDDVFRNYADNYTGYRNYRRQMASEWKIADDSVRERYKEWKKAAKGLKSDFDKFYGGGIVD